MDQHLRPGQFKLNELRAVIESWEESINEYELKHKKTVDEDIKASSLKSMTPTALRDDLDMNDSRLVTYLQVREEIMRYLDAKESGWSCQWTFVLLAKLEKQEKEEEQAQNKDLALRVAKWATSQRTAGTEKEKEERKVVEKEKTKAKEKEKVARKAAMVQEKEKIKVHMANTASTADTQDIKKSSAERKSETLEFLAWRSSNPTNRHRQHQRNLSLPTFNNSSRLHPSR